MLSRTVGSNKLKDLHKYVIAFLSFLFLIIIFIGFMCWKQRHHKMEAEDMCLIASVNPDYVSSNYTEDEWELVRGRVNLLRELGQG